MKNKRTLFIMAGMLIFCAFAVVRPDEVRALLSFYGPRTGEPAGEETWRFREKESAAAGTYFLFEPEGAEERRLPLVVVLHGAPGNAYAAAYLSRPRLQTEYPSFILDPPPIKESRRNGDSAIPYGHFRGGRNEQETSGAGGDYRAFASG